MKKMIAGKIRPALCVVGVMMTCSLAACTPTPQKQLAEEEKKMQQVDEKLPDANAPELDVVSIYSVREDGSKLEGTMDAVEELTPEVLVQLLIQYGVLEEGTELVSFEAEGSPSSGEAGPGQGGSTKEYGVLNLSKFPDKGNNMLLQAVANTFLENMNVVYMTIQVNGETVAENLSMVDAGK